ncbi:MAG: hypothetical protein WC204_10150, partial [Elusimicrobiales bacterium]
MKRTATLSLSFFTLFLLRQSAAAQENLIFQTPPAEILALADYKRAPSVTMDSRKEYMLLTYRNTYKSLDELNQEELRLGGIRINPAANISTLVTYANDLKLRKVSESVEMPVSGLPPNPKITNISWSRDEKKIAFTHTTDTGVELWVIDVGSAAAKRLTGPVVNANLGRPYDWLDDNETLLVRLLPKERSALIDTKKELPKGPSISVGDGSVSQNQTFQDLLKNPTDEKNFETLAASELYKVSLSGEAELFKASAMYSDESVSPDGKYVLVTTLQKPFSYIVPFERFPQKSVVYDLSGKEIKTVNEVPLNEAIPKGFCSVRTGKREMAWRDDKPSTLYYVEALDGGDQANKAEFRDEIFLWDAPFSSGPVPLFRTRQRFNAIIWGDESSAVAFDTWYDTRNMKTYLIDPSKPGEKPKSLYDRDYQDIYSDPGSFETKRNAAGKWVLLKENGGLFLLGDGHTKDGQYPFVDKLDLKSLKTDRLYRSSFTDKKEELLSIQDAAEGKVM